MNNTEIKIIKTGTSNICLNPIISRRHFIWMRKYNCISRPRVAAEMGYKSKTPIENIENGNDCEYGEEYLTLPMPAPYIKVLKEIVGLENFYSSIDVWNNNNPADLIAYYQAKN